MAVLYGVKFLLSEESCVVNDMPYDLHIDCAIFLCPQNAAHRVVLKYLCQTCLAGLRILRPFHSFSAGFGQLLLSRLLSDEVAVPAMRTNFQIFGLQFCLSQMRKHIFVARQTSQAIVYSPQII